MIKKIKRVSPLQLGKIAAVLYGILSLIFLPFVIIPALLANRPGPGVIFILILPIIYVVMGFIMAVITAAIYNLCAKWVGGIEIELEDD